MSRTALATLLDLGLPMASAWYYQTVATGDAGLWQKVEGPVTSSDLKRLAREGWIRCTTKVRKGADGPWILASQVKRLFDEEPAESSATVPPPLPYIPPVHSPETGDEKRFQTACQSWPPQEGMYTPFNDVSSQPEFRRSSLPIIACVVAFGGLIVFGISAVIFFTVINNGAKTNPERSVRSAKDPPQQAELPVPMIEAPDKPTTPSLSTPEAVVKSYLAAKTWHDRLPYVFNADRVRPEWLF